MPAKKKSKKWSPHQSSLFVSVLLLLLVVVGFAGYNYNQHHRSDAATLPGYTDLPLLSPNQHPQVNATVKACKYTYLTSTTRFHWNLKLYVNRGTTYVNSWYVFRHTDSTFIYRAEPASWWHGTDSSADITLGLKSQYPTFSVTVYHRNSDGSMADGTRTAIHYATDLRDCPS